LKNAGGPVDAHIVDRRFATQAHRDGQKTLTGPRCLPERLLDDPVAVDAGGDARADAGRVGTKRCRAILAAGKPEPGKGEPSRSGRVEKGRSVAVVGDERWRTGVERRERPSRP